ncbi:MAG: type IV secretion system DNA-binding domain-containing protein [Phycisphaerae bacterium]
MAANPILLRIGAGAASTRPPSSCRVQPQSRTTTGVHLMRPNIAETRDPLVPELLPPSVARMELNYRTTTDPSAAPALWHLMPSALGFAGLVFAARLLLQLQSPRFTAALLGSVVLLMLIAAVWAWVTGRRTTAVSLATAAPILVTTLLTPASPIFAWIGFLFGAALTLQLTAAAIHHAAAWYSADYRVAIAVRRRFMAVWNPAGLDHEFRRGGGEQAPVRSCEVAEREALRSRMRTVVGWSVALLLYLLLFADSLSQSCAALVVFTAVNATIAFRSIRDFCAVAEIPWPNVAQAVGNAVALWFGYNRHGTVAPGVMISPAGPCGRRVAQFGLALAVFCATASLASGYFAQRLKAAGELTHIPHAVPARLGGADTIAPPTWSKVRSLGQPIIDRFRLPTEGRVLLGFFANVPTHWPILVMAVIGCATIPLLAFAALALAVAGRTFVHFAHVFRTGSPYLRNITEWDSYVQRLRESRDSLETEHVWLGVAIETDSPVIMHRQLAAEHVHLMGSTGSNKTSVGVTQLLEQLIGPDSSLLVLDLKGDMALFEAARLAAQNAKDRRGASRPIRFRWITTESDRTSYVFNPLNQSYMRRLPTLERTQILARAVGLEHGEGYGRGHFSSQNRNALLKLFAACPDVDSFRKLHEEGRRQKKLFTSWEREHASDMFSAIFTLANIDALNLTKRDHVDPLVLQNAIDMSELVHHPNIAYFRLPATSQAAANREVGKLAIYSLLTAIRQSGQCSRQIYIVIDEFQQLVSTDLAVVLQQARSYGVGVIMAHQTQSDLKLPEADMTQAVEENTHFKQIFSVNDLGHRQSLEKLSGEALYHLAAWKQGFEAYGDGVLEPDVGLNPVDPCAEDAPVNVTPQVGPRLRANDLIEMSARQNVSLVQFKRNVGYGQYDGHSFLIRTDYHIPRKTYLGRMSAAWPSLQSAPGTIVAPLPAESFFYQIGVEKPTATPQMILPFVAPQIAPTPPTESAPTVTNPPPSAGVQTSPAPDRNPIAEALDSL